MSKKCGYSFWGYLGDIKFDKDGEEASTPDGNAFYSWSIIRELQRRRYTVVQIMPDRDVIGYEKLSSNLFNSWCYESRFKAYEGTEKMQYDDVEKTLWLIRKYKDGQDVESVWKQAKSFIKTYMHKEFQNMEFILHEYRMLIPGRNDKESILDEKWQPDYLIQECLFECCTERKLRLMLFDLDYKLSYGTYKGLREAGCPVIVLELGKKWEMTAHDIKNGLEARQVYVPFDFDRINDIELQDVEYREDDLVYVGNRYERDWCIDKYIPQGIDRCTVYGNWLEGDRDSSLRWPNINFGERLQTSEMKRVYADSAFTILLAKKEYCVYGFMTARILEAIFYGSVPLFIEEYGQGLIEKYAGDYAELLTVRSQEDVMKVICQLRQMSGGAWINIIIEYLRDRLRFMDVRNFVDVLMEVK